jgi:DNA-binding PadR family transcriptional regulator
MHASHAAHGPWADFAFDPRAFKGALHDVAWQSGVDPRAAKAALRDAMREHGVDPRAVKAALRDAAREHGVDPRAVKAAFMGGGHHGHGHGQGRGGRGRRGGPMWGGQGPFPPGFPFHPGRGPRARRGDVRAALLALLAEEPRNGYQLMQEIERRSDGMWRPSPGSVYPALQQLEDEGLVRAEAVDGGRRFALTDAGRAHVEERGDALKEPWRTAGEEAGDEMLEMRKLVGQVGAAVMQVALAGTETQQAEARRVLADARRALYRILAEDEPEDEEDRGDTGTA